MNPRDEGNQLPEVLSILVRVDLEYLTDAVVVVPLLQELLLVCWWVAFDEILQLRQVGCKKNAATHDEKPSRWR